MNRKLRKLIRDPKLFVKDAIIKRVNRPSVMHAAVAASGLMRISKGCYRYVVVSAVYNVEPYLDLYFKSIVRQTLEFRNNIRLVMVDDGSTDGSADIIKKWHARYPDNIIYLHKENGGQASARNTGLDYIEEQFDNVDYVTFIDPDDFVDVNYFKSVDYFAKKQGAVNRPCMLSCNLIFYRERNGCFADTHPLRFRFQQGDVSFPVGKLGKNIQLNANSAFFDAEVIERSHLRFDEKIRPTFEDAHFAVRFLLHTPSGKAAFLRSACYYYRKRSAGDSALDTSTNHKGQFLDVLKFGCLGLVDASNESGLQKLPAFLQRTLVYQSCNYFIWNSLINHPERAALLDDTEKSEFLILMDRLFSAIDAETILSFELSGIWFLHKVGLLHCFKQDRPPFQIVYVEDVDPIRKQVQLRYFTGEVQIEEFRIDGRDIAPYFAKTMRHDFLDRTFVFERRIWVPFAGAADDARLEVSLPGYDEVRLSLGGKQHRGSLKIADIRKHFHARHGEVSESDLWLLMDRDVQADDNAEHFYRYLRVNHPQQNIKFVLHSDSHDWPRLQREGFDLLAYGSKQHEQALRACRKIISSHIDAYVENYFRDKSLDGKQLVFLQHGVIKDDLSNWLNQKNINSFITAASKEHESIAGDMNRYKFTRKEVCLTGLPRHDALLQKSDCADNIVLIMPTWRNSLSGKVISGSRRELAPDFMQSDFARCWRSFLTSERLGAMARQNGYRIVFLPHPGIQPYLDQFDLPDFIEPITYAHGSIQEWLRRSAVMVTDYSSVAFDIGYLNRAILYYQFDREEVFAGNHIYQRGYFDYDRDGFGPVCLDEEMLLNSLEQVLSRNAKPEAQYLNRMEDFFAFRDGKNCARVYDAICALDDPHAPPDMDAIFNHAIAAERAERWDLAETRWRTVLSTSKELLSHSQRTQAQKSYVHALMRQSLQLLNDTLLGFRALEGTIDTLHDIPVTAISENGHAIRLDPA